MTNDTLSTQQAIAAILAAPTRHIGSDRSALSTLILAKSKRRFGWHYDSKTGALLIDAATFTEWLAKPAKDGRPRKEQTK